MQTLAEIAGTGGWRTRKNECERQLGMTIENRQSRRRLYDGGYVTISEYRYVPPAVSGQANLFERAS